ncbi:hypothetical protein B0H14DRAFT_3173444 [Mycena olivaceomarginata]|nr:hypothetical protein B0H14DRAFT_3173444 [Mycena olivaceomarginata]
MLAPSATFKFLMNVRLALIFFLGFYWLYEQVQLGFSSAKIIMLDLRFCSPFLSLLNLSIHQPCCLVKGASSSRVLASTWASPSGTFSLSRAALGHPTHATRYPRWINPKSPPTDDDVQLDAPEDEVSGSAPPSQSAPPSSSDNSNSDPPDSDNPDAPAPPKPPVSIATTAKPAVPPTYTPLLALPIARRPLFPGFYKAVPYLGAFLLKDENNDADVIKGAGEVHDVGVFAQITSVFSSDPTPGEGAEGAGAGGGLTAVLYLASAVSTSSSSPSSASPASASQDPDAPDAALAPTNDLQDVLQSLDVKERLSKALLVLKKELLNAQLQNKLAREVEGKTARRQREYWLLGLESDGKDKLLDKFRARAAALRMPEGVCKVFDEELSKLAGLEPAASEAGVTRNYLEWLTTVRVLLLATFSLSSEARFRRPTVYFVRRQGKAVSTSMGDRGASSWDLHVSGGRYGSTYVGAVEISDINSPQVIYLGVRMRVLKVISMCCARVSFPNVGYSDCLSLHPPRSGESKKSNFRPACQRTQ